MIKAIIFDCFGVLVAPSLEPYYPKYLGNDSEKIRQAEEFARQSNIGLITYDAFIEHLARLAGIPVPEARDFLNTNPPNEALLRYIKEELKPNYKIGFLSNASDNWLEELFTPEDIKLFDAIVLSYEAGFAKPQAQIYEIAADNLGVRLNECVFIDDRQDYVDGAKGVGMPAIVYSSMAQLKTELSGILSA